MSRTPTRPKTTLVAFSLAILLGVALPGHAGAPTGQFTNNGNGTTTDNRSGLIWQTAVAATTYTQANADAYCANLTLGGSSAWRLPTIRELTTIFDACDASMFDPTYFTGTLSSFLWSSTPYAMDTTQYWTMSNNTFHTAGTTAGQVRCVR